MKALIAALMMALTVSAFANDKRAKSTEMVVAERNGTTQVYSGLSSGTTKVEYVVTNVVTLARPGTRTERFTPVCRAGHDHPVWRSCVEFTAGQTYSMKLDMDKFQAVVEARPRGENLTKLVTVHSRVTNVENVK